MQDMDSIYREHASTVFKYLMTLTKDRNLAEELTQETFYKAVYSIDNYDSSSKMTTWLFGIAKHTWYQELDDSMKQGGLFLVIINPKSIISRKSRKSSLREN